MALVTYTDPLTGEDITYDDSINTSTTYQNGQNMGTDTYSSSTGLPITTATDGSSTDLATQISNLFKGTSSLGGAGQLAVLVHAFRRRGHHHLTRIQNDQISQQVHLRFGHNYAPRRFFGSAGCHSDCW